MMFQVKTYRMPQTPNILKQTQQQGTTVQRAESEIPLIVWMLKGDDRKQVGQEDKEQGLVTCGAQ